MIQSRTHNCNELRLSDAGKNVTIVGWYENIRKVSKNLGFLILRDFYGTTQVVIETEEMMQVIDSVNKESTISVTGVVRERSSKNKDLATGEIEVVPEKIEILGKCIYNALPFEINQSKDADENTRLKYRYLDPYLFVPGRSKRLPCSCKKSSGKILCTATGTTAVQTDFNGIRV